MKYLLIALTFSFFSEPDAISWRTLTWSDFNGKTNGAGVSMTSTEISLKSSRVGDRFYFRAVAVFYPLKSFTTTTSEKILKHEQLHFDITELYARKINAAINPLKGYSFSEYKKAHMIYITLIIEWNKLQDSYDEETDHSLNERKQCEWEAKIYKQL